MRVGLGTSGKSQLCPPPPTFEESIPKLRRLSLRFAFQSAKYRYFAIHLGFWQCIVTAAVPRRQFSSGGDLGTSRPHLEASVRQDPVRAPARYGRSVIACVYCGGAHERPADIRRCWVEQQGAERPANSPQAT